MLIFGCLGAIGIGGASFFYPILNDLSSPIFDFGENFTIFVCELLFFVNPFKGFENIYIFLALGLRRFSIIAGEVFFADLF